MFVVFIVCSVFCCMLCVVALPSAIWVVRHGVLLRLCVRLPPRLLFRVCPLMCVRLGQRGAVCVRARVEWGEGGAVHTCGWATAHGRVVARACTCMRGMRTGITTRAVE